MVILEMATVGRHIGFSKLKTWYSDLLELSRTYESTLRSLKSVISIIFSVRTSKNGGHLKKIVAILKIVAGWVGTPCEIEAI